MAFPTFREDFEGSLSVPSTVFQNGVLWHVMPGSGTTGSNSISNTGISEDTLYTASRDLLAGNLTATIYFKPSAGSFQQYFSARNQATSAVGRTQNSGYFTAFTANGIEISLISGVKTVLLPSSNSSVSTLLPGSGYCWEFRLSNSGLSTRIIRTIDGASFNSGLALAGGWTVLNPPKTYSAYDPNYINNSGFIGIEQVSAGNGAMQYWDDLMYESAFPTIDISGVTFANTGLTQTLTAGGFTDPLFGTKWFTSNPAVATVSNTTANSGIITSVGVGTAIISVSGKRDTTQFATALITVNSPAAPNPPIGSGNIFSTVKTFTSGIVSSVKYTVFNSDGSVLIPQTNSGVSALGIFAYGTNFNASPTGSYMVEWFNGVSGYDYDTIRAVNAIVYGYIANQSPSNWILSDPTQRIKIDTNGALLLQPSQPGVTIPTVTNVTNLSALTGVVNANVISVSGVPVTPIANLTASITGTLNVTSINPGVTVSVTGNVGGIDWSQTVNKNASVNLSNTSISGLNTPITVNVSGVTASVTGVITANVISFSGVPISSIPNVFAVNSTTGVVVANVISFSGVPINATPNVFSVNSVSATGIVTANVVSFSGVNINSIPNVIAVNTTSGTVNANVISWSGVAVAPPNISGAILTDVRFIQQVPTTLYDGIAQGGGSNYITLAATESSIDNFHKDHYISLVGGSGAGQFALIGSYNGSTKQAFIAQPTQWYTQPDSSTKYSFAGYGVNHLDLNQSVPPIGNITESVADCLMGGRTQAYGNFALTQVGATGYVLTLTTASGYVARTFAMPSDFVNNLVPTRRY